MDALAPPSRNTGVPGIPGTYTRWIEAKGGWIEANYFDLKKASG
jgi:hypothetical protein